MTTELGEMGRDSIRRRENCGAGSEVVGGRVYGSADLQVDLEQMRTLEEELNMVINENLCCADRLDKANVEISALTVGVKSLD